MLETRLIDKTTDSTFSIWKIIAGKRMTQFLLLCITSLLLIFGCMVIAFIRADLMHNATSINFAFNRYFAVISDFYPFIICVCILIGVFGVAAILLGKANLVGYYGTLLFFAFALNAVTGGAMVMGTFHGLSNSETQFEQFMKDYDFDVQAKTSIDILQHDMNCCGFYSSSDWYKGLRLSSNLDFDDAEVFLLPKSCCSTFEEEKCISYYSNGCSITLSLILIGIAAMTLFVLCLLSILLLLGVLAAFRLKRKILETEEIKVRPNLLKGSYMSPEHIVFQKF